MKKYITIAIAVVVIIVIGVFIYRSVNKNLSPEYQSSQSAQTPVIPSGSPSSSPSSSQSSNIPAGTAPITQPSNSQQTSGAPAPASATVTYTNSGFSPSTITIQKNGTVTWVNKSSNDVRVASNPHPLHNGYPTTGGCVGSTFDSCADIPPGGTWSFNFTFAGSWGYHNHLDPNQGGTVVVQ